MVHLNRLDLSGDVGWGEGDDHTGLDDASLDTADGDCANTANLVDVLEGESEGLVDWSLGWVKSIEGRNLQATARWDSELNRSLRRHTLSLGRLHTCAESKRHVRCDTRSMVLVETSAVRFLSRLV